MVVASAGLAATACADGDRGGAAASVTVFAAASLTDAFAQVADAFEAANPQTAVELSFAGSSSLREQILAGAPADVFASADEADMDGLEAEGVVSEPQPFATNRLRIAVPAGNPAGIDDVHDLADPELLVGLCDPRVPCGELARQALDRAGVTASVDTNEPHVRALSAKIAAGELDAGIVYVTDVVSSGGALEGIGIGGADVSATYPIATVADSEHHAVAQAFVEFVLGDDGQSILRSFGFGAP